MNILSFFRPRKPTGAGMGATGGATGGATAPVAKERLQVLLTHERAARSQPEYLPRLRREILEVIGKYVALDDDKIVVHYENKGTTSKLELDIELPNQAMAGQQAAS